MTENEYLRKVYIDEKMKKDKMDLYIAKKLLKDLGLNVVESTQKQQNQGFTDLYAGIEGWEITKNNVFDDDKSVFILEKDKNFIRSSKDICEIIKIQERVFKKYNVFLTKDGILLRYLAKYDEEGYPEHIPFDDSFLEKIRKGKFADFEIYNYKKNNNFFGEEYYPCQKNIETIKKCCIKKKIKKYSSLEKINLFIIDRNEFPFEFLFHTKIENFKEELRKIDFGNFSGIYYCGLWHFFKIDCVSKKITLINGGLNNYEIKTKLRDLETEYIETNICKMNEITCDKY